MNHRTRDLLAEGRREERGEPMFSSRSRNAGSIRKIALVDMLSGPDNLAQPRDDLWWRYPSAENALSQDGRCVEISALDKHDSLQGEAHEEVRERTNT